MDPQPSLLRIEHRGPVTWVWLARPQVRNAFNAELISEISAVFAEICAGSSRAVVLAGDGPIFCAGADANWMREMASFSWEENYADALRLGAMLEALDGLPFPVVARVQGGAYGGGLGLLACCDSVVCTESAQFSLSEVRLGLSPATISPYVLAKCGMSATRELFLSARRFDARAARDFGLVHQVVPDDELDAAVEAKLAEMLLGGPHAQSATKRLLREIGAQPPELLDLTARLIAELRASAEGQEGLAAFVGKRKPSWA